MKFYVATDHAGIDLKNYTVELLKTKGHEVIDLGPYDKERVDYPDYAIKVCESVLSDSTSQGFFALTSNPKAIKQMAYPTRYPASKVVSPQASTGGVFTHNPYWYEGFDLSGRQPAYRFEELPPFPWSQQHWTDRKEGSAVRPPLRSLRSSNMRYNFVDMTEHARRMAKPPSPDSYSDHTLGYSDSDRSDRDGEERDSVLESQLVQAIVEYFGECKGSLPSERVQNVIKKDNAELYEAVVVARFRKKWHKFLQHCSDTFQLFTRPAQPAPNQDYCWRIRLVNNADWEEADQQDEEYRARRDKELLDRVHAILSGAPDGQCLMIDVISEMNKDVKGDDGGKDDGDSEAGDSQNRKARKIRAGDLKRLMRKSNSNFTIVEYQDGEHGKRSTYMRLTKPDAPLCA